VEIDWQAASGQGMNDGHLTMCVDGTQQTNLTGVDNDTRRIDSAQLGLPVAPSANHSGTLYFDGFEWRRTSYIGPLASLPGMKVAKAHRHSGQAKDTLAGWLVRTWARLSGARPQAQLGDGGLRLAAQGSHAPLLQGVTEVITITYQYDGLKWLTAAGTSDGSYYHYEYNAVGNRLSESTQAKTTNYAYDQANRLTSAGGVSYTWDANGNLLDDGVNEYGYDHAIRLVAISNQLSVISYAYNGQGDQVSQTVDSVTTYSLNLAAGLTQVLADGTNSYL
jgi:YD repeat-containing protein